MTFYAREISRIKKECYQNDWQIRSVIATRRFIDENFAQPLTLAQLSRVRFISKFHLLRTFKRYYGQTPKQYLTEKRIEKAKELLENGVAVTETCFDVGYENSASFSTLFKGRMGITPSEFQKRAIFTKPS